MMVFIPVKDGDEWRAKLKPDGVVCPHLGFNGTKASCAVHKEKIFEGSPCWIYGNSYVDPDFINKRGKPCPVGKMYQIQGGGLVQIRSRLFEKSITADELEDIGPWEQDHQLIEIDAANRMAIKEKK